MKVQKIKDLAWGVSCLVLLHMHQKTSITRVTRLLRKGYAVMEQRTLEDELKIRNTMDLVSNFMIPFSVQGTKYIVILFYWTPPKKLRVSGPL